MKYEIDATNQPFGRLASKIALLLRDKNKPSFQPYLMPENKVIIFNADNIKFTGRKLEKKIYYRYTGYPGGIKSPKLNELFSKDSRMVLRKTVLDMLPKNKLRSKIIKNLTIYKKQISS